MAKRSQKDLRLRDQFDTTSMQKWQIQESADNPRIDGNHVIAKATGSFFAVNDKSLNGRYYKEETWDHGIDGVRERLNNGGLLGTIGHDDAIDEKALKNGDLSHIVTKLEIGEDKVGRGEILILGTDAGKNLAHVMAAGVKIPVSSRAFGRFEEKKGPDNTDVVDPSSFILETFDFVLSPGIPHAYPSFHESAPEGETDTDTPLQEQIKMPENEKDNYMLQRITEEKLDVVHKLNEAQGAGRAQDWVKASQALLENAQKVNKFYAQKFGKPGDYKLFEMGMRKFLELEPFKSYAIETGLLQQFGLSAKETIDGIYQIAEKLTKEIGSTKELQAIKEAHTAFTKFGTVEQVTKQRKLLEAYSEIGTLTETSDMVSLMEAYIPLGSPKVIAQKLKKLAIVENRLRTSVRQRNAAKISEAFKIKEEVILKMLEKMPAKELVAHSERDERVVCCV